MSRICKCAITGEKGTTDTFIKIKGRYYKSQEIYDAEQRRKALHKELVDYVVREFLGYEKGQPFPTALTKRIKENSFYGDAIILETFKRCVPSIHYALENKQFQSQNSKISYIWAIVDNKLADVYEEFKRINKQENSTKSMIIESTDLSNVGTKGPQKNICQFLDEDDF